MTMSEQSKVNITEVWLDTAGCNQNGMGIILNVDLNNGACMTFSLDSKIDDLHFADILHGRYRGEPKTDGGRVYWDNGASLSLDEMIAILQIQRKTGTAV